MTESTYSLTVSRTFKASQARVFEAWMNPADLMNWWHMSPDSTTPVTDVDLRVGGHYRLGMTFPGSDEMIAIGGQFLTISPNDLLEYTWSWEDSDEPESKVRVEFIEKGDSTEVIITHGSFESEERKQQHLEGWIGCMNQLDPIL